MSYEKKVTLSFFIAIGIAVIALGYDVYKYNHPTPKFKSGDCIARVNPASEFFPETVSDLINQIVKIGKREYLTISYIVNGRYKEYDVLDIGLSNKYYAKVDCKTGERK